MNISENVSQRKKNIQGHFSNLKSQIVVLEMEKSFLKAQLAHLSSLSKTIQQLEKETVIK